MAPWKTPLAVVRARGRDPEPPAPYVSYQDRFDNEARAQSSADVRALEDHLADPASVERLNKLVTDVLSGDAVLATSAPRRQSSPADASSGGKGAGVSQHLTVVSGRVIQMQQLRDARARRLRRGMPRPTGGSAA